MTIVARFPVELDGHVYAKGEPCEYLGEVTPRIAHNFSAPDGSPLSPPHPSSASASPSASASAAAAAISKTISVMGREGMKRALDALNVPYSPYANNQSLAKTLLAARGEIQG